MTDVSRRESLLTLASLFAGLVPLAARGQSVLPNKTIRLLVGFMGGGGTDILARSIASQLQRRSGRNVMVENRPGENGAIPGELVKKSPPDGANLAFLASTTLVSRLATNDFPFDPLTDLSSVTLAGNFPIGLAVSRRTGVSTFPEYLEWLKSGDDTRRRLGNTASAAFIQVFSLLIGRVIGASFETVTYRGAVPMVNDLEEGRLPAAASGLPSLLAGHRGGRLKLLMVSGAKRLRVAPDIPTAAELGYPDLQMTEWFGVFAAPRTPVAIIEEWNRQFHHVLADRNVIDEFAHLGVEAESSTPQEMVARIEEHMKSWRARMEMVGLKPAN